jgi:hypothetical protein
MAKYIVEILGSNASYATVYGATGVKLVSAGGAEFGRDGRVRVASEAQALADSYAEADHDAHVAVFEDRALADQVGLACRWNNQRYRVIAARGRVRRVGQVVTREALGELTGCQDGWRP